MEIWKPVHEYENEYEVSSYGRVRSLDKPVNTKIRHNQQVIRRGRMLKAGIKRNGYMAVDLSSKNRKTTVSVHRLVATSFLPKINGKTYINHKNGNKQDNRTENLEWCTASENSKHRFDVLGQKVAHAKRIICVETQREFESSMKAAEWLDASKYKNTKQIKAMGRKIRACATGRQPMAYGYHWKDVNVKGSTTSP